MPSSVSRSINSSGASVTRAALVPKSPADGLDNVANEVRAPLVWQYLQTHFMPQYEENGMVWWHRK